MNCTIHSDRSATAYCRNCGRPMCAECTRSVRGVLYCEDCLAALLSQAPAIGTHAPNPALAAVLGFVPGLGAIYNGEYVKGIVHIAIFAGVIAMLHNPLSEGMQTFFGISLACFYLYMPIEAYRTAHAKQMVVRGALRPAAAATAPAGMPSPIASSLAPAEPVAAAGSGAAPVASVQRPGYFSPVTGAVILITLGVLVLLANLGMLEGEWLGHWWPAILVGIGVWMLWKRFREPAMKGRA
jgi:TM2 domain-containing membrane protein YozV